ncbi:UNVERIFIED_CONTAM: hypothetical protein HDU68_007955 [Siphonaria sp. JEL0065]|nr:hypothetical protein HDU68_007955 [Siphonaria sp. JEL0065]
MSPIKKLRAIANFDCAADTPQELSFKKGDVIIDVVPAPEEGDEWYSGRLEKSKVSGLFPGNFCRFVPVIESDEESDDEPPQAVKGPLPTTVSASSTTTTTNHSPMSAYTQIFSKQSALDKLATAKEKGTHFVQEKAIPFATLAKEKAQESGAKVADRIKGYNETVLKPLQRKISSGALGLREGGGGLRAVALFDCVGDTAEELSFKKGDLIVDVKAAPEEGDNWWSGRVEGSSVAGYFPGNYVKFAEVKAAPGPPFIPAKPSELKAAITSGEADTKSAAAPWMNQVSLKPIATSSPAAIASTVSSPAPVLTKRAPPPPPPSSSSLSAKFASIGLTTVNATSSTPSIRAKPPPPPVPQSKSIQTQQQIISNNQQQQQPTPEHYQLYEKAFRDFASFLNPGTQMPIDSLLLSAKQVRTVWLRSRLESRVLAKVWRLVVGGEGVVKGALTKQEFW